MPGKKPTGASSGEGQLFVILHDEKNSRHFLSSRDQLMFTKKDNLKVGTFATFSGNGDRSLRCRCLVVISGTKEHCETSLLLINRVNNNFTADSEPESNSSPDLIVNGFDESENEGDKDDEEEQNEDRMSNAVLMPQRDHGVISKGGASTTSRSSTSSVAMPSTTVQQSVIGVLTDISNSSIDSRKRKVPDDECSTGKTNKKRSSTVSHAMHEKLQRENIKLQKELEMYRTNWMRRCLFSDLRVNVCVVDRPTGATASYFIEIGKILSGSGKNEEEEEKGEKLDNICSTLQMSESDLKACEHETDVTKTCRAIVKRIFPHAADRSRMLVSLMDTNQLKAVQTYARLVHPAQAKVTNSILNNAIGNVFASEKRKLDTREVEKQVHGRKPSSTDGEGDCED